MFFGGAGSTAHTITAGAAAQQNDDIAGGGALAADVGSGGSAYNGTDLHALCHIAGMIDPRPPDR